jgi:hypothetical protein
MKKFGRLIIFTLRPVDSSAKEPISLVNELRQLAPVRHRRKSVPR